MPLLDLAGIFASARDLRHGYDAPPYSARAMIETHFPNVTVTGEKMPRAVKERVFVDGTVRAIVYNRRLGTQTQRVSIIHGLAHLVFDLTPNRSCSLDYSVPFDKEPFEERRAELFAGEVLVPLHDLDRLLGSVDLAPADDVEKNVLADEIDHLSSTFKVPRTFMRRRIKLLERLRRTEFFVP